MNKDTVYRDRIGGKYEYFTYSEGIKYYVSEKWVLKGLAKKNIKIIEIS